MKHWLFHLTVRTKGERAERAFREMQLEREIERQRARWFRMQTHIANV